MTLSGRNIIGVLYCKLQNTKMRTVAGLVTKGRSEHNRSIGSDVIKSSYVFFIMYSVIYSVFVSIFVYFTVACIYALMFFRIHHISHDVSQFIVDRD